MRQHHTKVHGEPLPNRTCEGCGLEFYDPKSRRNYCNDCNPNGGSNNGNWKDAKEEASCVRCGETFEYYPSNKEGVYCPSCVADADGLLPDNPSTPGERVSTTCAFCESELEVYPSRVKANERGVFCGRTCYGNWLSETVVGENHHQWEGGPIPYGRTWWKIRRRALERDDYRCQACGRDNEAIGRNPDVHHVIPVRTFDDPEDAYTLDNVVSLCRRCHRLAEEGSIAVSAGGKR
ncbi:HNH endonuclease [Natronosalvus caseinilyticus]|uniref:HNH endonuclease n=1 Tax=Natronosalvus caseinilyticus TaxID=2953747 RepID=UPI003CCDAFAA